VWSLLRRAQSLFPDLIAARVDGGLPNPLARLSRIDVLVPDDRARAVAENAVRVNSRFGDQSEAAGFQRLGVSRQVDVMATYQE